MTVIILFLFYDTNTSNLEKLRKFPYSYQVTLSICIDIDETNTLKEFLEIHRYLYKKQLTSMGKRVSLEIGNTFLCARSTPKLVSKSPKTTAGMLISYSLFIQPINIFSVSNC